MNKKGNLNAILLLIGVSFLLLFFGLFLVIGSSVINWVFDESVPELTTLGVVGDTNLTQVAGMTLTPVNTFVQNFTWLAGVFYILGIVGVFGIAIAYRSTGSGWLIALFILCVLLLVISSIFISNIYEDFYDDDGELATRLHEHKILSFLILYSPVVFSILSFMAGLILFSGSNPEVYI